MRLSSKSWQLNLLLCCRISFPVISFLSLLSVNVAVLSVSDFYASVAGRTLVTFYVVNVVDDKRQIRRGVEVVSTLGKKLRSSADAFDFRVVELDTVGEVWFLLILLIRRYSVNFVLV